MEKNNLEIKFKWDNYNTALAISKLLRHTEKGEIEIEYKAKKGSLDSFILAKIIDWTVGGLFYTGAGALIYYFWNRIRKIKSKKRKRKGINYDVTVKYEGVDYLLTGEYSDPIAKKFEWNYTLETKEQNKLDYKNE